MFGRKKKRAPSFGGISADDDLDIEVQNPDEGRHSGIWAEARLLFRDVVFALMMATLVVVFIVQPVKVEGTSMLPRLHDGERIFVNKLIYYKLFSAAIPKRRFRFLRARLRGTASGWRWRRAASPSSTWFL